jgi:hypothetical protein
MRRRSSSLAASILAATLLALSAGTVAAVGSLPAAGSDHLVARGGAGGVRAILDVLDKDGSTVLLSGAVAGLADDTKHRVIGSTRACVLPHLSNARTFVAKLPSTGRDGAVAVVDRSAALVAPLAGTRSLRVFTGHTGGTQRLCLKVAWLVDGPTASGSFPDRVVITHRATGTVQGSTVAIQRTGGSVSVSSILMGLPDETTTRLAATTTPCSASYKAADAVFVTTEAADGDGVIAFVNRNLELRTGSGFDATAFRALKATAAFPQRSCSGLLQFEIQS